jgi:hypothetical protein
VRLAGLEVLEPDASQMLRMVRARLNTRKRDGLITYNAVLCGRRVRSKRHLHLCLTWRW